MTLCGRSNIGDKDKTAARTREYEDRFLSPFVAAERGYVNAVIMPHSTRRRLAREEARQFAGVNFAHRVCNLTYTKHIEYSVYIASCSNGAAQGRREVAMLRRPILSAGALIVYQSWR